MSASRTGSMVGTSEMEKGTRSLTEKALASNIETIQKKRNHSSRKRTSNVSTTSSARLRAEAEMAALLARQRLLNGKHALEEQEEQIRKRKEHLQFEADIAASVAKVNVLRASGSGVGSAASRRSNGMESYFEKKVKTDAETFIPHTTERNGKGEPAIGNAESHFGATRPRQKEAVNAVHLHQEAPELIRQSTFPITTAHPVSYHRDVHTPSFMNSSNNPNQLLSIMEKQNEITAMLVHQQRLSSLPKRDIQTFDGDPLQYHAFMRTFEQTIEGRSEDAVDRLHFLEQDTRAKPSPLSRAKGSSFATTVSAIERKTISENTVIDGHSSEKTCLYCKGGHMLELCSLLEKRAHREKIDFLKTNGVCFGCLCIGHISKDCRKHLSCGTCGLRHPSMLHIHPEERGAYLEKGKSNLECTVDSSLVAVQTSGLTGAGEQNCKLAIVPVKVKSTKGQRTVETYAFLDQGSSASFRTLGVMNKLNLSGRKTKILLRTMGQEKIMDSCIVSDLEVAGLVSGSYCKMPDIFTQHTMPVNRSNIPRQQHLYEWPHLKQIYLPEIDADVELLIGMNVPTALQPLKVIRSVDKGPYAIKTMLGWTVNGPLSEECCDGAVSHPAVTINRISAVTLDELWKQQFKSDFPESNQDEQPWLSREDCKFSEMANKTVKLVDCHYSSALPLKNREMSMPNHCETAEQPALNLKRRLIRDVSFHKEYTALMTDLIPDGYAESVPASDLERSDGKFWYIPHHRIYHPKKGKIRVVLDCGASFQGLSTSTTTPEQDLDQLCMQAHNHDLPSSGIG